MTFSPRSQRGIVLDIGSWTARAGLSGSSAPEQVFSAVVGRPLHVAVSDSTPAYCGRDALDRKAFLSLKSPLIGGNVSNWDDMEKLWSFAMEGALRLRPEEHCVIVTERPGTPKEQRDRSTHLFFEKFRVEGYYSMPSTLSSLFARGLTAGCVIDSGESGTHIQCINNGYTIAESLVALDVGGRTLTEYMAKMLFDRGFHVSDHSAAVAIKEKYSFVSSQLEADMNESINKLTFTKSFTLPDGQSVALNSERFVCPEALFSPNFVGSKSPGIHVAVKQSIGKCGEEMRSKLYQNIVLSGGNTLFRRITDRLHREISNIVPSESSVTIQGQLDRVHYTWLGASVFSSLSTFRDMWISKQEYEEFGPSIIRRKCPV